METIALYLTSGVLGGMVFFASVVAPTVFQTLPPEKAGIFLRALFPKYYLALMGGSGFATFCFIGPSVVSALATGSVAISTLWVRQILVPKINRLRDSELGGDAIAGRDFARLHRISVIINLIQFVLLTGILVLHQTLAKA